MISKKIFITGAGSGLGKNASIELARRGHIVYASVRYSNEIRDLERIAKKESLKLSAFRFDILDEVTRNSILNYDIDVLICNAAIGDSGSVAEVFVDRIETVFNTNVFCNIRVVQLALKNMIKNKKQGRIVFLGSMAGRIPMAFLSPYCASKFALEAFATCLRKEMKKLHNVNIQVGIIEPGAYATGFNKENNEKKWTWMKKGSYFINQLDTLKVKEELLWNFIEIKPYHSIIKKYIHAVEDKKMKHRYCAPWYQALFVQIGRIFGL